MGFEDSLSGFNPVVQESGQDSRFERAATREARLRKFAETGDPTQLEKDDYVAEEASELGLIWNDTAQSWSLTYDPEEYGVVSDRARLMDDLRYLREKGFAVSEADADNPEKVIKAIIPYLAVRNDYRDNDVTEIYNAIEEISNQMAARFPLETTEALFNQIDFAEAHSFQKTRRVLSFIEGLTQIDEEVADVVPVYLSERCGHAENNAFTDMLASDIWNVAIGAEERREEMPIAPAGKGLYAAFSFDGDRMYVTQDNSGEVERIIESRNPNLVWQAHEQIMNQGSSIEETVVWATQGLNMRTVDYDKLLFFLSDKTQKHLQEVLEIDLARELELSELYYSFEQLSKTTVSELEGIGQFSQKYGLNGFRSFLALNEDESLGKTIVELGENLPPEVAKKLFNTYTEVVDASEKAVQEIKQIQEKFGTTNIDEKTLHSIAKNIRSRANNLLRNADKQKTEPEQILAELEDIHASSIMQSEMFLALVRNGDLSPEHLDMVPSREKGIDISEKDRAEMLKFFDRNYKDETEEFRNEIISSFLKALQSPGTNFYILRDKEGHIVAFSRIDQNEDELYFGSFNVHNMNTQGSGIGSYMLQETLREAKDCAIKEKIPIRAHCDPNSFITQKYIEWGFVATKIVTVAGKSSFEIEYNDNHVYEYVDCSHSEIEQRVTDRVEVGAKKIVFKTPAGAQPDWTPLSRGYVLTRFFSNSEGELITAFEKRQTKSNAEQIINTLPVAA